MPDDHTELNLREQLARIDHERAETQKYFVEMEKYSAEMRKLEAEARHFDRQFWLILIGAVSAGAGLFAAGAAFIKVLG